MSKKLIVAVAALFAVSAYAGEYHSGNNLLCSDCHTIHFSMQHNWDGTAPVSTTGALGGNWLSASGPNEYLLKAPANELCLSCHDGQSFAPDVLGMNINAAPTQGRSAGALNQAALGAPYEAWKGHTLGSTTVPPGFNPTIIGASATWYDSTGGLECISCHAQHGPATAYRNLGPYALGGAATSARPTYVISSANDTTKDVWINQALVTVGSGSAATFNPYYDYANITFNRNDATVGTNKTSNKIDTFCAACHGDFHGGAGDTNIGATAAVLDGFIRHPTSQVTIGAAGAQGYGGHSALSRYTGATTKTRVYASDRTCFTDATPGCVTCHKAHGNQNPFGLFFLNRAATSVGEEGGYGTGQTQDLGTGYRNLCGQCHGQGNL
jgi:hypothetical protein